jgi:hypothetical protein
MEAAKAQNWAVEPQEKKMDTQRGDRISLLSFFKTKKLNK